jgi:enterochelin esterase-like enzyme
MNTDAYCKEMLEDVIPFVEANYDVQKDASGRAFAGLSMGGRHSLTIALRHSDRFSQIGAFSSAPPSESDIEAAGKDAKSLNDRLKVFWVACGDKDFLFERNQTMHSAFEKLGIAHNYVVTEGDDHSWPVWRRYLETFAPMVFQN